MSDMLSRGVLQSDASYKRGVILGLTMAEAVLLLLFSLLLALAAMFLDQKKDQEVLQNELDIKQGKIDRLIDIIGLDDPQEIPKELIRLRGIEEKIAYVLRILNIDGKPSDSRSIDDLVTRITKLIDTEKTIKDAGLSSNPDDLDKALKQAKNKQAEVAAAKKAEQEAQEKAEKVSNELKNLKNKLKDEQRRADRLEGAVASMQRMMNKGTEKPACWADKATGKPKYIYNVGLTNDGIIVRHSATPPFSKAEKLPIDSIPYDRVLKPREFRSLAKPIYDWSEKKECRFFVRVWDRTGVREKTIYKRHKRFLETRFYAYEVLNDPWK